MAGATAEPPDLPPRLATFRPLPRPAQDDVIGVWGRDVYYAAPAVHDAGVNLKRVTVPAACRVG